MNKLLEDIREYEQAKERQTRFDIDRELFQSIIQSIDTEWDRKCARVFFGCNMSETQMKTFGLKANTIRQDIKQIQTVIHESRNAELAAEDLLKLKTENKLKLVQEKIDDHENMYRKSREILPEKRSEDVLDKIVTLKDRKTSLEKLLIADDDKNKKRRKGAIIRIKTSLIENNRLKQRRLGAGASRKMDSEDEQYVAECIEDMASTDGRRHESVMYLANRIKQRDLLSIANYNRLKRGKTLIKSVTTVLNRGRPKNVRSRQAKCHSVGKWLFCTKKPPKTAIHYQIHTRHQRQARKLAKLDAWSSSRKQWSNLYMVVSKDDKAYLRPGTSVGTDGIRSKVMYMSSNPEKQPSLPQHDWPEKRLYITPSAHRFMAKMGNGNFIDGDEQLISKEDFSLVTVRPKHYIGSSGSVWASDFMMLRFERPDLYEIAEDDNYKYFSLQLRQLFAILIDSQKYFLQTNVKSGVLKVTKAENCAFKMYELHRLDSLENHLLLFSEKSTSIFAKITQDEKDIVALFEEQSKRLRQMLNELKNVLKTSSAIDDKLWEHYQNIVDFIGDILTNVQYYNLPPVRPRLIEFTDAGPGVGCSNYEVKFRDQEMAWLHNSSLRTRIHLATDDQGQNEAERVNAYIGDALADGTALKSNYYDKYHGLSENQRQSMTEDQLIEHEAKMVNKNAWCIVEDVVNKIHDEPGPGGCYLQAFKTNDTGNQFFHNTGYLSVWRKSGQRKRSTLPGHEYFSSVEKAIEMHYQIGELYFEYIKCPNDDNQCNWCERSIDIGPRPDPIPKPIPGAEGHYEKFMNTPRLNEDGSKRMADENQPRAQLKKMYLAEKDLLNKPEKLTQFCKRYLVEESSCLEYLKHLGDLDFRKRKRSEKRSSVKNQTVETSVETEDDHISDEEEDIIMEELAGSDNSDSESSDEENIIIQKSNKKNEIDNNSENKTTYVTKFGRKATKFLHFQ